METKVENIVDQMIQEATAERAVVGMEILPLDYLRISRRIRHLSNQGEINLSEKEVREAQAPLLTLHTELQNKLWGEIWEAEKDHSFPSNLNKTQMFVWAQDRQFATTDKMLRAKKTKRQMEISVEVELLRSFVKMIENSVPTTA